jgi:hypothetical protein
MCRWRRRHNPLRPLYPSRQRPLLLHQPRLELRLCMRRRLLWPLPLLRRRLSPRRLPRLRSRCHRRMSGQRSRLSREQPRRRLRVRPCRHRLRLPWGCLNRVLRLPYSLLPQAPRRVQPRRAFRVFRGQVLRARRLLRFGMCRWGHSMQACPRDRVRGRFFPVRVSRFRPASRLAARFCLALRDPTRRSRSVRVSSPNNSSRADKACRLVILCARLSPANRPRGQ